MDPVPFTDDEKRFVLAEMIKSSAVDLDALTLFIQTNNISPNWMHMQLPHGRNMKQCMQVAEHLSSRSSARNRQPTSSPGGAPCSRDGGDATASTDRHSPAASSGIKMSPLILKPLAHIAPRPVNGAMTDYGLDQSNLSLPGMQQKPTRKRGRPSKADMAKRDLKPNLPQYIAPKHAHQRPGYQPILPALGRPQEAMQTASPDEASATGQPERSDDVREKKRCRIMGSAS